VQVQILPAFPAYEGSGGTVDAIRKRFFDFVAALDL
jgi:hypothetical protein